VLHGRQFVIGPEPFSAPPDWRTVELEPGIFVSHCPALRTGFAQDLDGTRWMLLGLAVQTEPGAPDPLIGIEGAHSGQVPDLHPAWAGRWLLVGGGLLHLDASGLLGCFHGRDRSGRAWASSSPALLRQLVDPDTAVATSSGLALDMHVGVSWYPPPRSRSDSMRRLLPSQTLGLRDGEVLARQPLPEIRADRSYEETVAALATGLVEAVRRLPRDQPLTVSVSAGLDSRVVLAAAERAAVPYAPFTRISRRMSPADRILPPRLAAALGRPLRVQRRSSRRGRASSAERLPLVIAHCDAHISEGDAHPLLEGTRDELSGIMLGGWAWDVGKATMREKLPPSFADARTGAQVLADAHLESSAEIRDAFREWLEWVELTPQAHLDWRDRFYLEQRLAGWQSAKEQVYDMLALERVPIVNSGRLYSLMLEVDEARRITRQLQWDLVERLCPPLAAFPANPTPRELGFHRAIAVKLRDDPVGLARMGLGRGKEVAHGLVARRARRESG
jgi:hypothetical protein